MPPTGRGGRSSSGRRRSRMSTTTLRLAKARTHALAFPRAPGNAGYCGALLALSTHELIGAPLERIVDSQRLDVGERQVLHQDHARNAPARIDPEIGVVDAAPAQAAG